MKPAVCLSALAVPLAVLALSGCAPKATPPLSAPEIKVVYLEGEVKVDGKAAEIGQSLKPRSVVETGPASRCDLVFGGRNALGIGQNSLMTLDLGQLQAVVRIERGGLGAVLKGLAKVAGKDSFILQTQTATAGVRGTALCVWAKEGSTYVCACNGEVHTIDAKGGNELELSAAHHAARLYSAKGAQVTVDPAGLEYHTDATVEALAARIGYTIDWTKPDR